MISKKNREREERERERERERMASQVRYLADQDPVEEEEARKTKKPQVSCRRARQLVRHHYALTHKEDEDVNQNMKVWAPTLLDRILRIGRPVTRVFGLNSYDDRNFRYYGKSIVKFYNGVESSWPGFIDAQARAMERVRRRGVVTNCPVRTKEGKDVVYVDLPSGRHAMRVLRYLPGKLMGDEDVVQTDELLLEAGSLIGKIDAAFENFDHIGFHRNHLWDLKHFAKLKPFVEYIPNGSRKDIVLQVLREFETEVLPVSSSLRESVIHNDANDQNILTSEDGSHIIGVVDWGDSVKTWLVCEIAISMAYVMLNKKDILRDASLLLAGYCGQYPLQPEEYKVLGTLIASRLACSVTMSSYSYSKDPGNKYLLITQEPGWKALEAFVKIPKEKVLESFLNASRRNN